MERGHEWVKSPSTPAVAADISRLRCSCPTSQNTNLTFSTSAFSWGALNVRYSFALLRVFFLLICHHLKTWIYKMRQQKVLDFIVEFLKSRKMCIKASFLSFLCCFSWTMAGECCHWASCIIEGPGTRLKKVAVCQSAGMAYPALGLCTVHTLLAL